MKKVFICLIIAILFYSCIKVDSVQPLPKYSIYGIIAPHDSLLSVFVGKVYAIGQSFPSDTGKYVSTAKVWLESELGIKELFFNKVTKKYQSLNNNYIKSEKVYTLKIKLNDGEMMEATTVVPNDIQNFTFSKAIIADDFILETSWNDDPKIKNYYKLTGLPQSKSYYSPYFYWDKSLVVWRVGDNEGKTIKSPQGLLQNISKYDGVYILLTLQNMEKIYFDFDNKLVAIQNRSSFTEKFETPILFESNIKNGLGLFSSYTEKQVIIQTK